MIELSLNKRILKERATFQVELSWDELFNLQKRKRNASEKCYQILSYKVDAELKLNGRVVVKFIFCSKELLLNGRIIIE